MRFDLTDLRLFLAVVDGGTITHGAADAGLSLPAASERLRDMEADGGVKLLERGRRGVTPTEAGESLAHHARQILRQVAQMRGELGEHAKGLRATVRVLANTAALTEFLPDRLAPWMAVHPQVDLEMRERQSAEIARAVSAGLAEIGVLSEAHATGDLQLHPFALDRLVVVAARHDELAGSKPVAFADILHRQFIGLMGSALQDHVDAQAVSLGTRLKTRVRMRSFEGICRMAAAGAGLGIVPETAVRRLSGSIHVASMRLLDAWATRKLSVCIHNREELTPQARSLFDHLTSNARLAHRRT
ncbi:LysR family transcriptional regulator [Pannonibacter phragmitetus]|uniref:LysR family transcriptional regulator n=1 Tax=Pannonibacter phragmitetus TaxID=121719 RepID=UPI00067B47ED|nr:LysR family transcriptional regulator [Pannonibacter phragmitetus]KND19079.1 LysR family transcriptional regulator [Pannonibacter phragmitetus]